MLKVFKEFVVAVFLFAVVEMVFSFWKTNRKKSPRTMFFFGVSQFYFFPSLNRKKSYNLLK